jgi:carbonic anhydrase
MSDSTTSLSRSAVLRSSVAMLATLAVGRAPAFAAPSAGAGVSPNDALARLVAGNKRFAAGTMTNQDTVTERRLALTGHQAPFAALLSCSDSRVPPELVFDQNVGDLFVYRDAGNFVGPSVLGTMEYGYAVLGVKLIVVVGHDSCGAVLATYDAIENKKPLPPNLDVIQHAIEPGIASVVASGGTRVAAVIANAKAQALKFKDSPVLGPAMASGDCRVVAADYHFQTGLIEFFT